MVFEFQGGKDHCQGLAASLGMPDQAFTVFAFYDPFHNLVHCPVLLVAADLFDYFVVCLINLEYDKVGQYIHQP